MLTNRSEPETAPFRGGRFFVGFGGLFVAAFIYTYLTNIPGPKLSDFGQEFSEARARGEDTFIFNGKTYTTQLAGDTKIIRTPPEPEEEVAALEPQDGNYPVIRSDEFCPIVTDGTIDTFRHELAHCNGWNHPDSADGFYDERIHKQPKRYVHPYKGKLIVIMSRDSKQTRTEAQPGTKFYVYKKSPMQLCHELWKKHGIKDNEKNLAGCAVVYTKV